MFSAEPGRAGPQELRPRLPVPVPCSKEAGRVLPARCRASAGLTRRGPAFPKAALLLSLQLVALPLLPPPSDLAYQPVTFMPEA